jgi:hypothetical protein
VSCEVHHVAFTVVGAKEISYCRSKERNDVIYRTELKGTNKGQRKTSRSPARVHKSHGGHASISKPGVYFLPFFPSLDLVFALTFTAGNTNLGLFLTSKAKNSSAVELLEGGRFSSRIIAS